MNIGTNVPKEAAVDYFRSYRYCHSKMKYVTLSHSLSSAGIRTGYLSNTKQPRYRGEARNMSRHLHSLPVQME